MHIHVQSVTVYNTTYRITIRKILRKIKYFLSIAPQDLLIAFVAIFASLTFISVSTYLYFAKDLTSKTAIMNYNNTGIILTDRNGKVFFKFGDAQYKKYVPLKQVPPVLQQAVIAAEDKDFYKHPGFSIKSIAGAFIADIKTGKPEYGGSTITQQLVKNSLLQPQRDIMRKFQEVVLAQELEHRYSKQQILEMYLNSVYFGEGAFGIEEASQAYFGIPADKLDLAQASMLAGILNAPSQLSPISGDPSLAKQRQEYVLNEMVKDGDITTKQKDVALAETLNYNNGIQTIPYDAPNFALYVKQQLDEKYGAEQVARSGFVVRTSIDLTYQDYAQQVVAEQVKKLAPDRVSNGAAVVMDPKTGEVLALVGSKDWNTPGYGKVDIPVDSARQPGSSFKPIVYAAALQEHLITPATILHDTTRNFTTTKYSPPYIPTDYDNRNRGPVTARRALANSLNIPAVEVMQKVGVPEALNMAHTLGITTLNDSPNNYGLSLVLGAGEVKLLDLTDVYATFADGGIHNQSTTILDITDKTGKKIYHYTPQPQQVLDPGVAFQISSILSDAKTRHEEFGNLLDTPIPAAVKTGTTQNYKDSLTMGYTPNLTVGVWVGNNDGELMDNVAGSLGAAPIWKALMTKFLTPQTAGTFIQPSDIVAKPVCGSNGVKITGNTSSNYTEYFLVGTEPKSTCNSTKPVPEITQVQLPKKPEKPSHKVAPPVVDVNPPVQIAAPQNPQDQQNQIKQQTDQLQQAIDQQIKDQLNQQGIPQP